MRSGGTQRQRGLLHSPARRPRPRDRMGTAWCRLCGVHRYRCSVDEDAEFWRVHQLDSSAGTERLPSAFPDDGNTDAGAASRKIALPDTRADGFARLFEAVHEGVYIGLLRPRDTATLA